MLAAKVVHLKKDAGHTFSFEELKEAVEKNKPTALFLCQACPAMPSLHAHAYLNLARQGVQHFHTVCATLPLPPS